jgi:hypothetical protein
MIKEQEIPRVSTYQTTNGRHYTNPDEALRAQGAIDFGIWYRQGQHSICGYTNAGDVLSFLKRNRKDLLEYLNRMDV